MIMRFLAGFILLVLVMITGVLFGGAGIAVYYDLSSTFILVLGSFFAILMFNSPREIRTAFVHAFAKEVDMTSNYETDIILFASLHKILFTAGIIGLFTGGIAILNNPQDASAIGSGLAQALIINLYALILQVLLTIPCKAMLKKKQSLQQRNITASIPAIP